MQRVILLLLIFTTFIGCLLIIHQRQTSAIKIGNCVDTPAIPDYLSTGREQDAIAAINNVRKLEHLHPLHLPGNYYSLDPAQQQFILLNLERTDRGLKSLAMDDTLAQMALAYDKQLLDLRFFSHTSPIGGTFSDRINNNPSIANHFSLAAENLAGNPVPGAGPMYEYMYNDTVEACGHRNNILDPKLTEVGIAWISGSPYGSISSQEFIASAPWNPYIGTPPDRIAPKISIGSVTSTASKTIVCKALAQDNIGVVRITWFLDGISNQSHVGPTWTLNLSKVSAGRHVLYAYAVDGEGNYGVGKYVLIV